MKDIVIIETKRIFKTKLQLIFFAAVLLLSLSSSYRTVMSYELRDKNGLVAGGKENLEHGKENAGRKAVAMLGDIKEAVFVDETNIEKLAELNYPGREAADLSKKEIELFLENRLERIEQGLNESGTFSYTEREKEHLMEEAGKLEQLTVGFAEGWKTLNRDIGSFIPFILIMVSIIIMPLFADDDQTGMKEFCRSTMKGKKQLDIAGMITAYGTGSLLYLTAILIYSVVKMIPFGLSGAGEYIQSSEDAFFSVFHITYLQQFIWNCLRGYVSLIFAVSMTILISVMLERIMAGIAVICLYWGLLLIMNRMVSFEVNHMFANFMPLRLAGSYDFYVSNEIYRFAGNTFDSIIWCPAVAFFLSVIMAGAAVSFMRLRLSAGGGCIPGRRKV